MDMAQTHTLQRKHLLISGRVQGVWYRASLQEQAQALHLGGWCRNLPDGRVEAEVEGPAEAIDILIRWCHTGPPHALVETVAVEERAVSIDSPLPTPFAVYP